VAIGGYLAAGLSKQAASSLLLSPARSMLLPGKTTHGHHQIELACESCHSKPFAGRETVQDACVGCHGAELKAANDTHPLAKFTDPRNADRLEKLEATLCVTCHVEHRPAVAQPMGVTLAGDFCFHCHAEVAKDRPSHEGMAFNTCNSAGCHKYHDNRALYEDFLAKHLDDAALKPGGKLRPRGLKEFMEIKAPLTRVQQDFPGTTESSLVSDWVETAHARAGVNCSGCHKSADAKQSCAECHAQEDKGFRAGKHGMRLAVGLTPMTPGKAQLPMRPEARHAELGCTSCHAAHRFDTKKAAVEACLYCHADEHSLSYRKTKHFESGVSCASCHLPRVELRDEDMGIQRTLVQHNQSETLAPSEKMVRPVCLECHGLGFSIDALAGRPVQSLDMVRQRIANRERSSK
jgi:hypothetical protein